MSLFIWKSSQFYFWNETSRVIQIYNIIVFIPWYKEDILLQCFSPWELWKLRCWRRNKDKSHLKSGLDKFLLHLVWYKHRQYGNLLAILPYFTSNNFFNKNIKAKNSRHLSKIYLRLRKWTLLFWKAKRPSVGWLTGRKVERWSTCAM